MPSKSPERFFDSRTKYGELQTFDISGIDLEKDSEGAEMVYACKRRAVLTSLGSPHHHIHQYSFEFEGKKLFLSGEYSSLLAGHGKRALYAPSSIGIDNVKPLEESELFSSLDEFTQYFSICAACLTVFGFSNFNRDFYNKKDFRNKVDISLHMGVREYFVESAKNNIPSGHWGGKV